MIQIHTPSRRDMALLLAGPAAVGFCLGLRAGIVPALTFALVLPAVLVGVTLITTPALYIGAAFAGLAPPAKQVVPAVGCGLRDTGLSLLGLAPALLFLTSTSNDPTTVSLVGKGVLLFATGLGLFQLYRHIFGSAAAPARTLPLFAVWGIACLGIGGHLIARIIGGAQ